MTPRVVFDPAIMCYRWRLISGAATLLVNNLRAKMACQVKKVAVLALFLC
ncbi:MAG: hypothetical protein K0Q67_2380 [Cellvibrio sp.]|jgi:hypothetical protein|nr:hypothetical protein [Cellvibrio sp.]MDF3013810.1 hypothetical protein [Cellvibrio sp.]